MLKGLVLCAMGIGLIILCVMAYIAWWGLCFGSVLLGIVLLIFAPQILFLPNLIGVPGITLFFAGLELMFGNHKENVAYNIRVEELKRAEEVRALIAKAKAARAMLNESNTRHEAKKISILPQESKVENKSEFEAINARREAINLPPLPRKSEVCVDDDLPF